jgi:hypothetical protein
MLTKARCADDRAEHRLVLGRRVERGQHVLGKLALAEPFHHLGQELTGEPGGLRGLSREGGVLRRDRVPQLGHESAAPHHLRAGGGDRDDRDDADHDHGGAGRSGDQGHGRDRGRYGRGYGQLPDKAGRGPRTSGRRSLSNHQHPQNRTWKII